MDMKITRLVDSLRKESFKHKRCKRIEDRIKQKIYEAWTEKTKSMSKRRFWSYLEEFWIERSTMRKILTEWEKLKTKGEDITDREVRKVNRWKNYKNRYIEVNKEKKIEELNENQIWYIVSLRIENPNMWYKRLYTKLFIPEEKIEYEKVFWEKKLISKRLFYEILKASGLPRRITKWQKRSMIQRIKDKWDYEQYISKMKAVYGSFKALHKWQVDIKYLIDIPNMIPLLWLWYLYQLTFRDYKTGMVLVFYGIWRDQSRTVIATETFAKMLEQIGIDVKKVVLQFDWGAEFSTLKVNGVEGTYLEYVKKRLWGYKIINKKEENGHVESFHRMCEEEFFDSKFVKDLGMKITPEMWLRYNKHLTDPIKEELLKELHKYIQNHNKYWYSSYWPRYAMFRKRSPIAIAKDDRWDTLRYDILEQFMWAYDIDRAFTMKRKSEYPLLINSIINLSSQEYPKIGHFSAGLSIFQYIYLITWYYKKNSRKNRYY